MKFTLLCKKGKNLFTQASNLRLAVQAHTHYSTKVFEDGNGEQTREKKRRLKTRRRFVACTKYGGAHSSATMHDGTENREGGWGLLHVRASKDSQGYADGMEVSSGKRGASQIRRVDIPKALLLIKKMLFPCGNHTLQVQKICPTGCFVLGIL